MRPSGIWADFIQICDAEDVKTLKGAVSKDHVPMHIEYALAQSVSDLVTGQTVQEQNLTAVATGISRFAAVGLGAAFWAIEYGTWSTGNLTEELVS